MEPTTPTTLRPRQLAWIALDDGDEASYRLPATRLRSYAGDLVPEGR